MAAEIAKLGPAITVGFAGSFSVDKDEAQVPDRQGIGGLAADMVGARTASN